MTNAMCCSDASIIAARTAHTTVLLPAERSAHTGLFEHDFACQSDSLCWHTPGPVWCAQALHIINAHTAPAHVCVRPHPHYPPEGTAGGVCLADGITLRWPCDVVIIPPQVSADHIHTKGTPVLVLPLRAVTCTHKHLYMRPPSCLCPHRHWMECSLITCMHAQPDDIIFVAMMRASLALRSGLHGLAADVRADMDASRSQC